MKILRIHNQYRERGGEDVSFESEARMLEEHGEEVTRLIVSNNGLRDVLPLSEMIKLGVSTIWSRSGQKMVSSAVLASEIDVVHFDNTFPLLSPAVYSSCQKAGTAVVQTLHNYRLLCPSANLFRDGRPCEDCLGKRFAAPGIVHACYRSSRSQTLIVATMLAVHNTRRTWHREVDRFIAPSEFTKRRFVAGGFSPNQIAVKPHFISAEPEHSPEERNGFVFVGRLAEYKGVQIVLDAWRGIASPISLKIVGDGPLEPHLRRQSVADPRVQYLGRLPRSGVLHQMKCCVATIVPSLAYETFGLTVIEAFACGSAVIASRRGALEELVQEGYTGLLFDPENPQELRDKVNWMINHPLEAKLMGENARREYEEKYTADRNYALLMRVYAEAVDHARSFRSQ